ncbi:MAG: hypothetical protein K1X83_06945 [Oligoflexia bacterium]|nr:hypothetical protein [Oligoflexia bacterium]
MTLQMLIATCAWLLLVLGYCQRYQRSRHVPLVLAGIGTDLALVLYLQITRGAVQKALAFDMTLLNQLHVGFSTAALLLYFPILYLGFRLVRGDKSAALRITHARLARVCLGLRTAGFILMFSMWKH